MTGLGLTARQKQALDAIRAYHAQTGRVPTFDVLASRLGLSVNSRSAAHRLVCELVDRGYVTREGHGAYRLVHLPLPTHPLSHGWRFIPVSNLPMGGAA